MKNEKLPYLTYLSLINPNPNTFRKRTCLMLRDKEARRWQAITAREIFLRYREERKKPKKDSLK